MLFYLSNLSNFIKKLRHKNDSELAKALNLSALLFFISIFTTGIFDMFFKFNMFMRK